MVPSAPGDASLTATVMFTDIVGSTGLGARLGQAPAEELRRLHDRLLGDAVEAHRGRVVKGLGDGIMATFASASDAVAAAVAIQGALDRHNRSTTAPAQLDVRVGLSAGDVSFEGGDCFGTPVVEAARLCAKARGRQILVSEVVRLLARSWGDRLSPVGTLELKGLPEAVVALEVDWTTHPSSPVPLPAALERPGTYRFVGRTEERELLLRAWKEAASGERRVVLVSGEPGIGKTRLVAELARTVHEAAGVVLYGRCDEELGIPYQPFPEALRAYVASCPVGDLRLQLGSLGGELIRLLPGLLDRVPELPEPVRAEPETERYRLLEAVRELFTGMSTTAPVLLVLDDLHWAAKPALMLLRHLLHGQERVRLMILGTYRDTDLERSHPLAELLADLRRQGEPERLTLTGLSEAELVSFIEGAAGHALDRRSAAFARAVHVETEGNPFFVTEVLRHLTEMGWAIERDGAGIPVRAVHELGIPEGVREVVARRLSRLTREAGEVLAVAAVIGREFELGLLAEAGHVSTEAALDALEEAEGARLVVAASGRADRYSFAHALVRSTLYDGLPTSRRTRLHRRIGLALEQEPDTESRVAELARHFGAAASLGEIDRAVEYARRAGDRARASLAFEDAAAHYERALEVLELSPSPDVGLRCDLGVALGEALHRTGAAHHREVLDRAAGDARSLGDARRLAAVAVSLHVMGYPASYGRIRQDVVSLLEEALAGLEEDDPLRARVLAVLAFELHLDPDHERRWALAHQALAAARLLGDPVTLAWALDSHLWTTRGSDNLEERLEAARELLALGEERRDLDVEFLARSNLQWDLNELGDVDGATANLDAMDRLVDHLQYPLSAWRTAVRRVGQVLLAGRLEEAERLATSASALGRAGGVPSTLVRIAYNSNLFGLRYEQGRLAELEAMMAAPMADARRAGFPMWRPLLALLYAETDRPEEARPHLLWFAGRDFANVPRDFGWRASMVALARVAVAIGERRAAATVERLLAPHTGRYAYVGVWGLGPIDAVRGLLAAAQGRHDEAERAFTAALSLAERMRTPTSLARTRLDWAQALVGVPGAEPRVRALAAQAHVEAERLGMARVARQAGELLEGP